MLSNTFQECLDWYAKEKISKTPSFVCPSRDIFQAKWEKMRSDLSQRTIRETDVSLCSAVAGEIGNNCFDHNLGQWEDIPGCWFQYGTEADWHWTLLADRGQGVLASLKRVLPSLQTDQEALEIAFSKRLSGRSPERRGNGLKFVRSIINGDPNRGLLFISGKGRVQFGGLSEALQKSYKALKWDQGRGTLACIFWGLEK